MSRNWFSADPKIVKSSILRQFHLLFPACVQTATSAKTPDGGASKECEGISLYWPIFILCPQN